MEIELLIEDQTFVNWANGINDEDVQYWEQYLQDNPHEKQKLMTARAMVLERRLTLKEIDEQQINEDWTSLQSKLSIEKRKPKPKSIYYIVGAIAASLLLLSYFTFFNNNGLNNEENWSQVITKDGEIQEFTLPDGSSVVLNANSALSYNQKRVTKLQGEAYFDVVKNKDYPFQVHTKDSEITVLGTSFNIKSRKKGSTIALDEGRVKLKNLKSSEEVNLVAGELAVIENAKILINKTDLTAQSSWKSNIWIFDKTPISEVINRLEETYGITVEIEDKAILEKEISGKLSSKSPSLIYTALEGMLGITISVNKKLITFENKSE